MREVEVVAVMTAAIAVSVIYLGLLSMDIDVKAFLDGVQSIAVTGAAVFGIWTALQGLNTWKKQLRGSTEYELARRLLRSSLRLRDAMRRVRNPMILAAEQKAPPPEQAATMDRDEKHRYGVTSAYQARWESVYAASIEFEQEMLEAEAIWGEQIRKLGATLMSHRSKLWVAVADHLRSLEPGYRTMPPADPSYREAQQRALYDLDNDDEFNTGVTDAVRAIESFVAPHLRR